MEKQTLEREKLYERVAPPGDPIPCNVPATPVNGRPPEDHEIRAAAQKMSNRRTGGSGGMKAEHIKEWLQGAIREEKAVLDGTEVLIGVGDTWRLLVTLIQRIWATGAISRQMLWVTVVLIPKGNSGDYRGVGLLEPLWKLIEKILDARLAGLETHDALHGFLAGRGTGTAILEAKLTQQLAYREQVPLYGNFIDLHKVFDTMD